VALRLTDQANSQLRCRLGVALALLLSVLFLGSSAEARRDRDAPRGHRTYLLSERTAKKLTQANELLREKDVEAALAILRSLEKKKRLNPLEKAYTHQMLGYLAANDEHFDDAAEHFSIAIAQKALPAGSQLQAQYNLGQIYLAGERPAKAVKALRTWFKYAENPNPSAYYLLAVAYLQSDRKAEALEPAQSAVALSDAPKESWLQLLVALYFDQKDYESAETVLKHLVTEFPKKSYWIQLAAVYSELDKEEESLAVQQIAYERGHLDQHRELVRLAQTYLYHGLPYRAALVMEKGLSDGTVESKRETWELLANSWLNARELDRSFGPMQRAAELSDDGELYVRLGQLYLERERFDDARAALQKAIDSGKLQRPGPARLLLGVALFNARQLKSARIAFRGAQQYDSTRRSADVWLEFIDKQTATN